MIYDIKKRVHNLNLSFRRHDENVIIRPRKFLLDGATPGGELVENCHDHLFFDF